MQANPQPQGAPLALRYAQPVPRYTSYPTVPYWNQEPYERTRWLGLLKASAPQGISLYVHLPFCEKLCTYCGCNKRITKRHDEVEGPYVDALLAEWAQYRAAFSGPVRLQQLHLGGGTPSFFSAANLDRLLTGLLADSRPAARHEFSIEVHPANTTHEQLEVLRKHGFNRLSIGVQDVDEGVLTLINRPQSIAQIRNCVQWGRELGYTSINFDFVYGLPGQHEAQIKANLALVEELRPERIAHYGYAHVPWKSPGQRAYSEDDLAGPQKRWQLRELAAAGFTALGYDTIGFDHFALPTDRMARAAARGRLSRNFMGYTTHDSAALIGLGCSAISEIGGAFAQNHKDVEAYSKLVTSGKLAHVNGHRPAGRDTQVSRMIRQLLCAGETSLPVFDLGYTLPTLNRLRENLREGLITIDGLRIKLTERGRVLARHVALSLDERYWQRSAQQARFSQGV